MFFFMSAPIRSKRKVNFNSWIDSATKEALSRLAKKSRRSRTQVLELLILAEAKRQIEKSPDSEYARELRALLEQFGAE